MAHGAKELGRGVGAGAQDRGESSPQLGEDVTTSADRPGDLVGDRLEHDHQAASELGE